ncbi:MAG: class I SAM-dependent methyltransferase [Aquificota bacterium]|nr:MAG: class I SAM-dependent methyltransferase [Aquificota bacterium]
MAKIEPFEKYTERYENWFEKHRYAYLSELNALKKISLKGKTLEVGVGSGRFAKPLGIKYGVEPSLKMAKISKQKGINVVRGIAEKLPFKDSSFNNVFFITTICFVDDLKLSFLESKRVLKEKGSLILGFIDKNTDLGKFYLQHKEENPFYRFATFFSTEEVVEILKSTGFTVSEVYQTIFHLLPDIKEVEPVEKGHGKGAFVVIKAIANI